MPKILMVASEAIPFAKTGGLADVVGGLSSALKALGHEVAVVMPRYRGVPLDHARRVYADLQVWFGPAVHTANVYEAGARGIPYYLVDCPSLFDRDGFYGDAGGDYGDNYLRFAVLSRAALTLARHLWRPHILHCHDWQAALVPVYLRSTFRYDPTYLALRGVFTIHNMGYQGVYPPEVVPRIGLGWDVFTMEGVEHYGKLNLLKGGIQFSDAITTVSPTYAREIQSELGYSLEGALRARGGALTGILNGVDYSEWSPERDPHIAARYSLDDLSGKRASKLDLLREMGLPEEPETPLIGMISRFDSQKGFDIVRDIAPELAAEDLHLVILGTGDPDHEQFFRDFAGRHPEKFAVRIAFDNRLAHKIEAGADLFLMPSRYEPCGLNQIYSLRYGTVPVVRATGGLDDTIEDSTGFKFHEYSGKALLATIRKALAIYRREPERWHARIEAGMRKDFSWNVSAAAYAGLYERLLTRRAAGAAE